MGLTLTRIIFQVNKYAFSGGQDSKELHRKLGANLDVSHKKLKFEPCILFHLVTEMLNSMIVHNLGILVYFVLSQFWKMKTKLVNHKFVSSCG
jgi:hypothetical protein